MSTESESDIAEAVNIDLDDTFHVRDEGSANWVLRKIIEARAYRERVAKWAAAETVRAERQEAFLLHRFGSELESWAREQIGKQHGRRRSIALPTGVIGFRQEPTKLLVLDERALVAWCRTHLPAALKVSESMLKTEIQAHIKTTGECPAGAEIGGGSERFYIK